MEKVEINGTITTQETTQAKFKARIVANGNALAINIPKKILKEVKASKGGEVIASIKFLQKENETLSFEELWADFEKLLETVPGLKDEAELNDLWALFLLRDYCDKNLLPVRDYLDVILKDPKTKDKNSVKKLQTINDLITKDGKTMGDWLGKKYNSKLEIKRRHS